MYIVESKIIYPEGDSQEIKHRLYINQLVDLNGYPLRLPLPTTRMIVYRVQKIKKDYYKGGETINYYLELVTRYELEEYVGSGG